MAKILLLNGPNLNLLGTREPEHYGKSSLEALVKELTQLSSTLGHELQHYQSNAEHALIEQIHRSKTDDIGFIIINPAAYTHTSIALREALLAVATPFIEVHLSNIHAREPFRHHSYFSDCATGVITGLGTFGYHLAIRAATHHLDHPPI